VARPAKYDWDKIRLDYESGLSQSEIHHKHDVPYNRLSERCKEWEQSEQAKAIIKGFGEVSEAVTELKGTNPDIAKNVLDIVKDKHPQFKQAMVALSSKIFNRALKITEDASASDLVSLAKGMQTVTDTLGISQRHASQQIQVNTQVNNQPTKIEWVVVDDKCPYDD